jgi:hypothetical protein
MIITPEKEPNKFVVIGPGFQIVISTNFSFGEYCNHISLAIEKNELIIFSPADSSENTLFFRSTPHHPTVLNILTEKEFDKLRRQQQYDQARAQGAPGSRIMRNQ